MTVELTGEYVTVELTGEIRRVHKVNYCVYDAWKIHRALIREGIDIGRCRVERLMHAAGLRRIRKEKLR